MQRDLFAKVYTGIAAYGSASAGIELRVDIAVDGIGHRSFVCTKVSFCLHDANVVYWLDQHGSQVQLNCGIAVIQDAYISGSSVDLSAEGFCIGPLISIDRVLQLQSFSRADLSSDAADLHGLRQADTDRFASVERTRYIADGIVALLSGNLYAVGAGHRTDHSWIILREYRIHEQILDLRNRITQERLDALFADFDDIHLCAVGLQAFNLISFRFIELDLCLCDIAQAVIDDAIFRSDEGVHAGNAGFCDCFICVQVHRDLFQQIFIIDAAQCRDIFFHLCEISFKYLSGFLDPAVILQCSLEIGDIIDQITGFIKFKSILDIRDVVRKAFKCFISFRYELGDGAFPAGSTLEIADVPRVISAAEDSDLACLCLRHRVQEETTQVIDIIVQIFQRGHHQVAVAIVIDRIVPPCGEVFVYASLCLRPFISFFGDGRHRIGACPHDDDIIIQRAEERLEVSLHIWTPAIAVTCTDNDQRLDIAFLLHEFAVDAIDQVSVILAAVRSAQVIIRDTELTDTEIIQLFEFSDQGVIIAVGAVIESVSWMHAPAEAHVVFLAFFGQLTQLFRFVVRIQIAPLIFVIWVIFRRIDIRVHLELAGLAHQRETVFEAPWITIETFDKSTQLYIWVIGDDSLRKGTVFIALFHHLGQGHHTIISAIFIRADDADFTLRVLIVACAQNISLFFFKHSCVSVCWCGTVIAMALVGSDQDGSLTVVYFIRFDE